jgi:uncharacterized protein DUF6946
MIPRLYVPLLEPEDVVRHLGKREKHWKAGRSAHALATVWSESSTFPSRIADALRSHPTFESAEFVDGFMERQVDLGTEGRPSQTDLLAIISVKDGLAILAVEGKAGESFGKYVQKWRDGSNGKDERLEGLCKILGLSPETANPLRYQLLHRAASAVLEARRYKTNKAVLLVHSFSDDKKGFADFSDFLQALGIEPPAPGVLAGPVLRDGVLFYAGWVQDSPKDQSPGAYLDHLRNYAAKIAKDCKRIRAWCLDKQSKR